MAGGGLIVDVDVKWAGTPSFPGRLSSALEKLARDFGALWQSNIHAAGAVDTGAYVGSIEAERVSETEWVVHDGVEYGIFVEFGTHRMAARPCAQPAIAQIQQAAPSVFSGIFS
jgi:hypothetical protein